METGLTNQPERPLAHKTYDLADLYSRFLGKNHLPEAATIHASTYAQDLATGKTFTEVEASFANEPLFVRRLTSVPSQEAIHMLYEALFQRPIDPGGETKYVTQLAEGRSIADIIHELQTSEEYRLRMIHQLYEEILERPGDDEGITNYVRQMDEGKSFAQIASEMKSSDEYRSLTPNPKKYFMGGKPIDEIREETSAQEELAKERAAREKLQRRHDAQRDHLNAVLQAYDELRRQQQATLDKYANTGLRLEEIQKLMEQFTERHEALVRERDKVTKSAQELRNGLLMRLEQLRQANERIAELEQQDNQSRQENQRLKRENDNLRTNLNYRTGSRHTEREYRTLLDQVESLRRENERLKKEAAQVPRTQGPVDSFLSSIGYTRAKLQTDARRLSTEERTKLVVDIRSAANRMWHPDGGKFPNLTAIQEMNNLLDQIDPRHDGNRNNR